MLVVDLAPISIPEPSEPTPARVPSQRRRINQLAYVHRIAATSSIDSSGLAVLLARVLSNLLGKLDGVQRFRGNVASTATMPRFGKIERIKRLTEA